MTRSAVYTIDDFIRDAARIMAAGQDRQRTVDDLRPLLERLMQNPHLLEERFRRVRPGGLYGYHFYEAPDGTLTINAPAFLKGRPTPIHDHLTWGIIGVYSGRQLTTRYRRIDDTGEEGTTRLEVVENAVLGPGATYPLLPPDDLHRIETVSDEPGISIHVLGADLRRQRRHVFEPIRWRVREVEGESMMR
jgi:predicted metal-dependent enzyme (double-stranded beta helix superfamily)